MTQSLDKIHVNNCANHVDTWLQQPRKRLLTEACQNLFCLGVHLFNQNFSVKTGFYFVPTRLACQHGIKDNFHRYPSDSGCQSNNEADSFKLKKVVFLKIFLETFMGFRLLDFNYFIQFFFQKLKFTSTNNIFNSSQILSKLIKLQQYCYPVQKINNVLLRSKHRTNQVNIIDLAILMHVVFEFFSSLSLEKTNKFFSLVYSKMILHFFNLKMFLQYLTNRESYQ